MAQYHLNEHLSPRLGSQLRRYGFGVTSSQGSKLLSDDDSAPLAHSATQQRTILTFNSADFVALHEQYMAAGKEHWGIVLSTEESISVLMRRLLRLLNSFLPKTSRIKFAGSMSSRNPSLRSRDKAWCPDI